MRSWPKIALALLLTGSAVAAAQTPPSQERLIRALQAKAKAHLDAGTVPGLLISVLEDGSVIHAQGLGWADVKTERPMTASTPINVASISKSVSAWGFLRFCQMENLSLDAPVMSLVSDFDLRGPKRIDRSEVTIRRTLSHTAGLSTPSAPVIPATSRLPSLVSVLQGKAGGVPRVVLTGEPGRSFSYSGGGYLLLQLLVEEQTGKSFASFMAREVLGPAAMSSSSFRLDSRIRDTAASYYRSDGRQRALYHLPGAAGGLYSTAEDMGRWLSLYRTGATEREAMLSAGSFEAMLEPQAEMLMGGVASAGSRYALGHATWESFGGGLRYVFHAGGNPGLRAYYFVVPETGNGMFLAANHDDGQLLFRDLIDVWAAHYGVEPPPLF